LLHSVRPSGNEHSWATTRDPLTAVAQIYKALGGGWQVPWP
jgi:hypothetical protein